MSADNQTTEAELYAACRQDVLAVHPSAREIVKGLSSVAIMALEERTQPCVMNCSGLAATPIVRGQTHTAG